MAFSDLLINTANVMRRDVVDDGMGSNVPNTQYTLTVATGVPCRVGNQSKRARFRAGQGDSLAIVSTVIIFTDPDTRLQERDRFVIPGQDGGDLFYDTETGGLNIVQNSQGPHHYEFSAKLVS